MTGGKAMKTRERPASLTAFLKAVERGFKSASPDRQTRECLGRVFAALAVPGPITDSGGCRVPANDFLEEALEQPRRAGGEMRELAYRIADVEPHLSWRRRGTIHPTAGPSFMDGHANSMVVGPGGLENRSDVWVGLSLLAPDVRYPDHSHAPEEIYLFLTDGRFRQEDQEWFTPGVGRTLYNRPNITHAMASTGSAPFLALWCLFA